MLERTLSTHHSRSEPRHHDSRHASCHPCTCTSVSSLESIGLTIPRPKLQFQFPLQNRFNCRHRNCNISNNYTKSQSSTSSTYQSHKHMSILRTLSPLKPFLTTRAFTTTARTMAPKQEWLVILPDYTGKLVERNSVRAYVLNLPTS